MDTLDSKVQELFDIVQAKKEKIKKLERPNFKTNLSFQTFTDAKINLHLIKDPKELVSLISLLKLQHDAFNRICNENNFPYKFEVGGFTYEEWESDIFTLINKINIKAEKQDLERKEEKLNSLISKEMKRQLEIEALEKDLKNG